MNRCRRRVLYLFGGLLVVAALFVPYRSTRVSLSRDVQTNFVWQRTVESGGYMFLFRYLEHSRERLADTADREVRMALRRAQDVDSRRYDLNTGRATSLQVQVTADVELIDQRSKRVLFSNDRYIFREEYQVSLNPSSQFEEDQPAMERLARDMARTLVTDILENF